MATRELATSVKPVAHVVAQAITATNTPSTGVDTLGFDSVAFLINIGTISNIAESPTPSWTFHVEESDTSNASFTAITDSERINITSSKSPVTTPNSSTGVFLTVDAAAEDGAVYMVGVVTSKRYVRLVATAAETPGSTPYSVTALLGHADIVPTTH